MRVVNKLNLRASGFWVNPDFGWIRILDVQILDACWTLNRKGKERNSVSYCWLKSQAKLCCQTWLFSIESKWLWIDLTYWLSRQIQSNFTLQFLLCRLNTPVHTIPRKIEWRFFKIQFSSILLSVTENDLNLVLDLGDGQVGSILMINCHLCPLFRSQAKLAVMFLWYLFSNANGLIQCMWIVFCLFVIQDQTN